VSAAANQPPPDIDALEARLAAALAERDTAIIERDAALRQNDRLAHLLRQLQRMQFGRRSEKLDPDQFALALEDIEQVVAAREAADYKQNKAASAARMEKRRASRGALPAHLPRVHVTIEPEDWNCPCCRSPMHAIGADVSERLDVVPAQFRVLVTHRPKYACRACEEAVVQAPAPERLIKGGLPTEAMVASVLVSKYAWHLPLYRQAQMLAAQGLDIKRSTLAFWVGYAAAELRPVFERLRELILTSGKIAVDETKAPVLDPGRGRVKEGYFWAVARDDRPWGGADPPAIAFAYAPGRGAIYGLKLLDNYAGVVQCDGYAAYKTIAAKAPDGRITLAFCWSHLRRRFFDHAKGEAPIAREALERIAALYAIEKTIRGASADERRRVRQEKSKPLVMAFRPWLEHQLARVSGKSGIADELRYGLNHWEGLVRFLDDGRIELDTNIVERGIRPIVLNRKNALFAGHDEGAENWPCVASRIETCKLNDVEPQAYIADHGHGPKLTPPIDSRPDALAQSQPPNAVGRGDRLRETAASGAKPRRSAAKSSSSWAGRTRKDRGRISGRCCSATMPTTENSSTPAGWARACRTKCSPICDAVSTRSPARRRPSTSCRLARLASARRWFYPAFIGSSQNLWPRSPI
jgi:transposase